MSAARVLFGASVVAALVVGVGCGGPAAVAPDLLIEQLDSSDEGKAEEAVRALAQQGAAAPDRIVPLLIARLEAMQKQSAAIGARVTPDLSALTGEEARNDALIGLTHHLHGRLNRAGFTVAQVRQEAQSVEAFVLPPADPSLLAFAREALEAELSRQGGYVLRAEMPPPFATTPERPVSPWTGDAASHAAWLAEETARFTAATPDAPYVPARADAGLVAVQAGPEAGSVERVALRLAGEGGLEVGDQDLTAGLKDDAVTGTPALYLVPRPGREDHVRAFLAANAGLTLWIVADGQALLPTRVPGKPGVAVTFPAHGETPPKARARAAALAGRLTQGRLPFPVKVELISRPTVIDPQHPVCRALVRTGPAAEPALEALALREPAFGPLVASLKDGILKTRTE